jgi:hypothetical protein
VVEAQGIHLASGQTVDGAKPLSLAEGQAVTLLTASGRILKLEGPSQAAPETALKGPDRADVPTAIAALITERNARTSEVGVVRGDEVRLPDPWLVDVTHPGTSCVQPKQPVVLWRSGDLGEAPINFAPKDRSWNLHGKWPAKADRLALPPSMPLRDRTDYVVDVGGRLAPVTVRLIPDSVNNDAMRASYMLEVGCGNQVNALLALYQK